MRGAASAVEVGSVIVASVDGGPWYAAHGAARVWRRDDEGLQARVGSAFSGGRLDREHLGETSPMPRLPGEHRGDEGNGAFERGLGPDDPRPEGQHVHVVMLDALVRRVRVVADGGAD